MATRQIALSTFWQLASQITMAALSILTVKFVAVGLSKELAGNYNSAYGFLQLFGILADFGLYAVAIREISKVSDSLKREEILGSLIILRTIILTLSLGIALLFVWLIPMWKETPLPLSVTIAALVPFFTLLAGIIRTVFQVYYKMQFVFIAEVSQRILTTCAIGVFLYLGIRGSTDLHILHLFLFFGGLGAFLLFFVSLLYGNRFMKIRLHWNSDLMLSLMKKAAPFGIAYFCVALYRQFDVTLIALLRPDFELQNAYYGFVVRMADMGFLIPTFLLNSTLPVLSERDARGEDTGTLLGKTFLVILVLGSTAALFAFFWARPLVALLTTESYLSTPDQAGSDTALRLISIPLFLNGIILYGYYTLLTKGLWKKLVGTLSIGALLSLILNILLIPKLGFVGAAYASIAVHILLAALLFPQAERSLHMKLPAVMFVRWGVFSILLGSLLYISSKYLFSIEEIFLGLLIMTAVLPILLWICGLHRFFLKKAT